MADGLEDYDAVVKAVEDLVDDWAKTIKDVAKKLADIKEEMDKIEALKKQRDAAAKDAQDASAELQKKIWALKVSPKADPQPFPKLPDAVSKMIKEGGVPLGNSGVTLAPSNWKFQPPPNFKVQSGGIELKIKW
ncbi:MAG TPA: hypothetical protein VJY39_22505 [Acidisphaera sp.]|nr:hypothetical protein [Acidisphaera sp.]